MIRLALRTLRFHKSGFLATFVAVFLGAMIMVGCGGLLETGLRAAAPPTRFEAAPIVVTGDQRYTGSQEELVFPERVRPDAALVAQVAALPGVAAAVPDSSFAAAVVGDADRPATKVTGRGWSSAELAPYRLVAGKAPTGAGQVVLDARTAKRNGLRPGAHVDLLAHGGTARYEISGLITGGGNAPTVLLSDADAARVAAHPGKIDALGVFPTPGTDPSRVVRDLRTLVRGHSLVVLTGDERGRAEDPGVLADAGDLIPLAAAFGGLSAMVAVFVVTATLGLSIRQRRHELALLRATGATPGQLRRLVVGETMLLTAVAIAPAWWLGPHVGSLLLDAFADVGVVPDSLAFRAGLAPRIAGIATALLTALAAAFAASGAAAKIRLVEALAEAAIGHGRLSRVRLVTGFLLLAGGAALAWGTAGSDGPDAAGVATPAAMVWTAGFGLLAPPLCGVIVTALRRPVRASAGLAGRLAHSNIEARPALTAAAVTPVMLATGLAIGLIYMQTTQSAGAQAAFRDTLEADVVVTSDAGGLPLELIDKVAAVPGVAATSARVAGTGYLLRQAPASGPPRNADTGPEGSRPVELPLIGVTAEGAGATTGVRVLSGSLGELHGNSVALPARHAGSHRLGDMVPLRLGDGSHTSLKLVATLAARPGYEFMMMPAAALVGHTDSALIPQILVRGAPGTDHTALSAALATLAADHPGLRVTGSENLVAAQDDDKTQEWMAYLVLAVVVGYATIALVNTLVLATVGRRREFTLHRLVGAGKRQVLRMVAAEAVVTSAAGVILGTVVGALTLVPLDISVLGTPLPAGSPAVWFAVAGGALALTLLATLVPAAALLRGNLRAPEAATD